MFSIIQTAIRERKLTILLSIILMLYGMYSYYIMPKQENPDIISPSAMVMTVFPGASAEDVEDLVTKKVEDEAAALEGVDEIQSISNDNVSIVVVRLDTKVDKDEQWDQLRSKLNGLQSSLPDECQEPKVDTDLVNTAGIIISLSGDQYSYEQLGNFAKEFKEELMHIDGIKGFDIDGELKKEVII